MFGRRVASRVLVVVCFAGSLSAPAGATGGVLDWISKLSGPEVFSLMGQVDWCTVKDVKGPRWLYCSNREWALRGALGRSFETSNEPLGSSGDIDLWQIHAGGVYLTKLVHYELTYGAYHFGGTGFESFWRHSLLTGAAFQIPINDRVGAELGVRVRYFTERFLGQDFGGEPEPERGGGEFNVGLFAGFGFK
jgi:hypothetical protein